MSTHCERRAVCLAARLITFLNSLEHAESVLGGVLNGVNDDETIGKAQDYVIRRYLETLWLPEVRYASEFTRRDD